MRWAWVVVAMAAGCGDDSGGTDGGGGDAGGRDGAQPPLDSGGSDSGGTDGGSPDAGPSCVPMPPPAEGFHVTPAGTAGGDGSMGSPWDLATALAQPAAVVAGSIIWVHQGTYAGVFQ